MTEHAAQQPKSLVQRHDNFETWYANNVQFLGTDWDLKMTFGEIDSPDGYNAGVILQHTAISVGWLQAKLMHYYLGVHLAAHEAVYGKIDVPLTVMPPEPQVPTQELLNINPQAQQIYELVKKLRDQFVSS